MEGAFGCIQRLFNCIFNRWNGNCILLTIGAEVFCIRDTQWQAAHLTLSTREKKSWFKFKTKTVSKHLFAVSNIMIIMIEFPYPDESSSDICGRTDGLIIKLHQNQMQGCTMTAPQEIDSNERRTIVQLFSCKNQYITPVPVSLL